MSFTHSVATLQSIHLAANKHLAHLRFEAITKSAATNISINVFCRTCYALLLSAHLGVGLLGQKACEAQ